MLCSFALWRTVNLWQCKNAYTSGNGPQKIFYKRKNTRPQRYSWWCLIGLSSKKSVCNHTVLKERYLNTQQPQMNRFTPPLLLHPLSPPLEVKWHFHFKIASQPFVNGIELHRKAVIDSFWTQWFSWYSPAGLFSLHCLVNPVSVPIRVVSHRLNGRRKV